MRLKIPENCFKKDDGEDGFVFLTLSSRQRDYVTYYQIDHEFPYWKSNANRIIESLQYSEKFAYICIDILQALKDEGSISWKQFDLIQNAKPMPKKKTNGKSKRRY